jgi:hypothetical protein
MKKYRFIIVYEYKDTYEQKGKEPLQLYRGVDVGRESEL